MPASASFPHPHPRLRRIRRVSLILASAFTLVLLFSARWQLRYVWGHLQLELGNGVITMQFWRNAYEP